MTCDGARRSLGLRLDGRLGAPDEARLEAHLAACAGCRAARARWTAASASLRALGPTPVPAGLADRAWRAAVAGRPALALSFVPAAWRVAAAGALAAAAVWIAVLAGGTPTAAPRPPEDAIELAVRLWTAEGGVDGE